VSHEVEPDAGVPAPDATHNPSVPPGVGGPPGWLLRVIHDQRAAFLVVGAANTLIGLFWFVAFQYLVGRHFGYMVTLLCAHVTSVLCAFCLYRLVVFRVRGHVLRDLLRFESVYLSALAVNGVLLPLLVEVAHLPVLVSQFLIVGVTSLMSWFGHKHFSFRRPAPEESPSAPSDSPHDPR
jgi:putative flippase GtrA